MSLAHRAERFPIARTVQGIRIRKLAYRNYLIFYVIGADSVDVIRIFHGARHWRPLLDEDQ
jgi:toxin ParE1/3/4